jgi:hypothetical protein
VRALPLVSDCVLLFDGDNTHTHTYGKQKGRRESEKGERLWCNIRDYRPTYMLFTNIFLLFLPRTRIAKCRGKDEKKEGWSNVIMASTLHEHNNCDFCPPSPTDLCNLRMSRNTNNKKRTRGAMIGGRGHCDRHCIADYLLEALMSLPLVWRVFMFA